MASRGRSASRLLLAATVAEGIGGVGLAARTEAARGTLPFPLIR